MQMRLTRRAKFVAACLGSVLLTVLAYLPGLPGSFVFDDTGAIANNPALHLDTLDYASLARAVFSAPVGGLLRPISTTSFALEAYLFGISPGHFKFTNICIHLMVGLALWFLARELFRAYRSATGKAIDDSDIAWASLVACTLWLVHPLNLTSVLYVVQRENSLSALFTALAILSYLVGRRGAAPHRHLLVWLVTPLLICAGALCKENAVLAPVYILVIEFTLLDFPQNDVKARRETFGFFTVFLCLPLLVAGGLLVLRPSSFLAGYSIRDFTLYERLISESRILLDYLRWMAVPDLRQLGLFHDDIVPSRGLLHPATTLPSVLAILALLTAAIWSRKRAPLLSFGIMWFFAGQLLESTLLPLELAYEHRNYLPLFGICIGVTGAFLFWAMESKQLRMAKALPITFILIFAVATAARAMDWHDELAFARSESRHHPHSARALAELQWSYVNYVAATGDTQLIPLAIDAAERSKSADPGSINQDIGLAYMYTKVHELAEARLRLQSAAAAASSATPSSTLQLALQTLLTIGPEANGSLDKDILLIFQRALGNPRLQTNPCFHAAIWNTYGVYQFKTGDAVGALTAVHRAVTLCGRDLQMRTNFVDMLLTYGDTKDAGPELESLKDSRDVRYLPEIHRLQREYAELMARPSKK